MTLALMLQFVPAIMADPAAAPDPATVVSAIMDQVALAAAPQIHTAGFGLWRELAAILVVWTGLRVAFTGDFRPWDVGRVVIALWFPWAMLTFYNAPLPGSTRSFTAAITDGGEWLQLMLIANTGIPVLGMVQEHVHLHPLWRDCGGAHAGVPRGQYRLDGCHCQRSPTEYEFPVA